MGHAGYTQGTHRVHSVEHTAQRVPHSGVCGMYVIVKFRCEYNIAVIFQVRGAAEDVGITKYCASICGI